MKNPISFVVIVSFLFLNACAHQAFRDQNEDSANSSTTSSSEKDSEWQGLASWYGRKFQKRRTASGERFDKHDFTAAHRTLPFGCKVRVICPSTGKSVIVRINDRGPRSKKRVIDLSFAAAKKLGIISSGVAHVKVEKI